MITYTEFFLFFSMMVAIVFALFWRSEAIRYHHLFKLMLTNKEARQKIIDEFEQIARTIE